MPTVALPTFHPGQVAAYNLRDRNDPEAYPRRKAIRCGRRWGKTDYAKVIACDGCAKKESIGWFTPDYKRQTEAYNEIATILEPVRKRSSKVEGVFRSTTGGRIDFWTLDDVNAGRSRKYHKVIIDEAAFTKVNMIDIWKRSIEPTLLDYKGSALALSNTNGLDRTNFFWQACNDDQLGEKDKLGFSEYHGPSHQNPYMPKDELARLERTSHPLVWKQEYLAEFVDWSGVQFFDLQKFLVLGQPVAMPQRCDYVFATIDTAIKDKAHHDGTAVSYWAVNLHTAPRLTLLDWDTIQVEGSLLEQWLPTVIQQVDFYSKACNARVPSPGVWIEDKGSGTILLQQGKRRGMRVHPIAGTLVSVGKDARAINVSGYAYQGLCKMSRLAYEKTVTYKGQNANHWMLQVFGYRVGIDNIDDDLFDTMCYGLAIALGNTKGH